MKSIVGVVVFCVVGIVLSLAYIIFLLVREHLLRKQEVMEIPDLNVITIPFDPRHKS